MPRAPKKCGNTACQERVSGRTYCPTHQAEHDARANTTQRGYGATHQAARRVALAQHVDGTLCPHCGEPMYRTQRLDLDHTDDRTAYRGLAHTRCNARAGAYRKRSPGT